MASMIDEKLLKILECAICLETYEEPKVLRCQHTYCRKCLEPMVIRDGRIQKVTCPECRDETKLPQGGVKSLRSNFLISNLLSVNTDTQSNARHRCEKHHEEIVELYCQVCDQPICRACLVIDHRGHSYKAIKDVFPREKRAIVNLVNEAKPKISALKAEAVSMAGEEDRVRNNVLAVNREIDSYFDDLITLLERKRQALKQDLSEMTLVQIDKLRGQKESLVSCLNSMEAAKQILDCTNKVEFLRTKNEITSKITDLRSVAEEFKPCEKVVYKLDKKPPTFDEEMVEKIGKVRARGEYTFGMRGGEPGILYTGRALQSCVFVITRNNVRIQTLGQRNVSDNFKVNILQPDAVTLFPVLENNADGTHSFRYRPNRSGNYKISICSEEINGDEIHGSPFTWNVLPALYLRSWTCYFENFGFRDYTYLSDCVFEEGQHSWRVRFLYQPRPQDYKCLQIGVKHPFRKSHWVWRNGYHLSITNSHGIVLRTVGSPMPESLQHGDVFVVFLNIDKRQMIMYNERTKESDIWQDIEVPVTPFLHPDVFLRGAHFDVFEM